MAILLPSADLRRVVVSCAQSTNQTLSQAYPGKSEVMWTDLPVMTIAVDWDIQHQAKQKL